MLPAALRWPHLIYFAIDSAWYQEGIIIDGLGFPGSMHTNMDEGLSRQDLAEIQQSGLTACHLTVGDVGAMPPLQAFEAILRSIDQWESEIEKHSDILQSMRDTSDIQRAKDTDRNGVIYGLQDGVSFEDDPSRLSSLHRAGIRVIQPTYNRRNLLGDGCLEPANAGLSKTGREAVEQICDLGITLDLSHCGRQTAADAMVAATRPASFTHTGCYSLAEHPRHRTDAEMRLAAESGGIVGIYIMPYLAKGAQPTASVVMDHIEHALNVAGEEHVSIGTDGSVSPTVLTDEYKEMFAKGNRERKKRGIAAPFETEDGYLFANDLNTSRRFETIGEMLLDRGHRASTVEKILGTNLQRLFADTWRA